MLRPAFPWVSASGGRPGPREGGQLSLLRGRRLDELVAGPALFEAKLPDDSLTLAYSELDAVAKMQELAQCRSVPTERGEPEVARVASQIQLEPTPLLR